MRMFTRSNRKGPRGFTLVELLVSSVISCIVVAALVTMYIFGTKVFKAGVTRGSQQQAANRVAEELADMIRPATRLDVCLNYPSTNKSWKLNIYRDTNWQGTNFTITTETAKYGFYGEYLLAFRKGWTSGMYRSGSDLYYIPDAYNSSSRSQSYIVASCLCTQAGNKWLFVSTNRFQFDTSVGVDLNLMDAMQTAQGLKVGTNVVVSTTLYLSPRNMRGSL